MITVDRWSPSDGLALEPNALRAAKETAQNLALTAGPGAGKTEMLAQRADFLLRTGACLYPRRILAISFKVDAAQNLKARVRRRCGPDLAARLDSITFHAFGKRLIDRFRPALTGGEALNPDYTVGDARIQHKSITFQDMVPLAQTIIATNRIARNAVRQTYSHVFLDEFQDCTTEQYALIKDCFLGSHAILTAVGDTKQSIMGWAGALEGVFETFSQDFDAIPLNLYQNFRSAPRLRRMQNAMVKVMDPPAALTDDAIVGDAGEVHVLHFADQDAEASALADIVRELFDNHGHAFSEIAILYSREQKFFSQSLVAAFEAAKIPYREEDTAQDLAAEPASKLIIDFLLVLTDNNQAAAHRRLLDQVMTEQGADDENDYRRRSAWDQKISELRSRVLAKQLDVTQLTDLEAIATSLVQTVGRAEVVAMSADYAHGNRLDQLIADTLVRAAVLLKRGGDPALALAAFAGDDAVRIMSMHKSKGLEFETVILPAIESQTFWGKLAAERALFFVGISRAKQRLVLTACNRRSRPAGFAGNRPWSESRTPHAEFLAYVEAQK